ncbi:hepatocyte growth factor activator-like [Neomonachus schauinslandi]|uniref:Hepatocyte growth factor activator-like n=2 Tax=Monachinae TaxID=3410119 RepID=A0A2Y9HG52_NEOSC|nr:hepatocyte growth factor activator-like [Neomonachus schauinslandi]
MYSVFNPSDHDLVLIRLKKRGDRCAVRSQFVQPICLPEPSSPFPAGHKCQIAGWGHQDENGSGYSSSLREALVPLVADHKCSSPEVYGADISPSMLCAGYFDCKSDACQGDSGGPLACEKNGVAYLYGIISWGDGCGRLNKPGVYTRVAKYVDWIKDRIWPPKRPADPS